MIGGGKKVCPLPLVRETQNRSASVEGVLSVAVGYAAESTTTINKQQPQQTPECVAVT